LAGSFYEPIAASCECAAELNVIFAKAHVAYDMKASVPELNNSGEIHLLKARHPLIPKDKIVPIDISLGLDFDALIVTGPNTGGKTVTLKTVGLLSLMAMCGLMLPAADQSRVSVFNQVLADIGDEQSIEQSLSTFSSHMTNIISILETADSHSLALIDELGAGTDPVEGAALAMSIIEALRRRGAKLAATTHYAELKAYALQTPGVENGSCEFDVQTLRPTYRLLIGVPGRSNAFAISERLGMPMDVVSRARDLVSTEGTRFEDVIGQLEKKQNLADQAKEETDQLKLQAMKALEDAEKIKAQSIAKQEKILEDARAMGRQISEKTRREAYALLGELERLKKEKDSEKDIQALARRARAAMKKGLDALDDVSRGEIEIDDDEEYVLPRDLAAGDTVRLANMKIEATVLEPPDGKGQVKVQAGSVTMRVEVGNLRLLNAECKMQNAEIKKRKKSGDDPVQPNTAAETRLDLRGQTVEECLMELDRYMDQALRTGVHEFTIVHGKGTGALRAAVQKYLKSSQFVKTYRLGVYGEGETGVTIVELK
jgi:DNA mismatch repair protein MutS2